MSRALTRRRFLSSGMAACALAALQPAAADETLAAIAERSLGDQQPFLPSAVVEAARALSRLPYAEPDLSLPPRFANLDYERYIRIRSRREQALFHGENRGFAIEPLHRGFVFRSPVSLSVIRNGVIQRVTYHRSMFNYGEVGPPDDEADLGFSGFRILTQTGGRYTEEAVFQGATYFRAIARGQSLGVMARGLSVRTSEPGGEEFPDFRMIFIEEPSEGSALVLHAIAESRSMTAAFRFAFRPGNVAEITCSMQVFARSDIANFGIGGLQTTYFFGPNDRQGIDDLRVSAFENDGLQMRRGNGEWLWRPVVNPPELQISAFSDTAPRGFGFMQRQRSFAAFEDDNQGFERRPSVYIEPIGDWQAGAVELIEIPTASDINDNVIAYWRPAEALKAGQSRQFDFRQIWCWALPSGPQGPTIRQSRSGAGATSQTRRFLVEFEGKALRGLAASLIGIELTASQGRILSRRLRHSPDEGRTRLIFDVDRGEARVVELRAVLNIPGGTPSETWLYRWSA